MAPQKRTTNPTSLLARTRCTVNAEDIVLESIHFTYFEMGLGVTLAALTAYGPLPPDIKALARLTGARASQIRRAWRVLHRWFNLTPGGLVLSADCPISRVKVMSEARPSLRRLFNQLVQFWGRACAYCGTVRERLAIEHIVPVARGGPHDITNLTLACQRCNSRKGTKTAAEFGFPYIHDTAAGIQSWRG